MELYTYRVPVYQNGPKAKFKGVVGFGARLYVIEASSDKDACTVLSRMIGQGDPRPLKCAHSIKKFKTLLSREPEPWTSRLRKACIEFDIDGFNKEFYYKRNDTDPTIAPFKFTLDLVSPLDGIFLKLVATPMSKCGKIDNPITGVCVAFAVVETMF